MARDELLRRGRHVIARLLRRKVEHTVGNGVVQACRSAALFLVGGFSARPDFSFRGARLFLLFAPTKVVELDDIETLFVARVHIENVDRVLSEQFVSERANQSGGIWAFLASHFQIAVKVVFDALLVAGLFERCLDGDE